MSDKDKKIAGSKSVDELKDKHDPDEQVANLRERVKTEQKRLKDYKQEHGKLETFFADVAEEIQMISPMPIVYDPSSIDLAVSSPCSAAIHCTDWHIGSVQDASEIEGFGEYSPEIAQQRVQNLSERTMKWIETHRASYTIDELVLLVTGDLISGDIHEELKVTNAFPSPVQAVRAGLMLSELVAGYAPHFPTVRVEFIVADNHSRLTKKPQAKEAGFNSFNYIVGYISQLLLGAHTNVKFNLWPMIEKSVDIKGCRYLCLHGNAIKGWAGIPYYGVQRQVGKEAEHRMNMPESVHFDKLLLGHFHVPLNAPKYMIGGGLSGTDAYDHMAGRHADPCQSAWLIHPKHGEFNWTAFKVS